MDLRKTQEKLLNDIKVVVEDVKERIHVYEEYKNSLVDPEPQIPYKLAGNGLKSPTAVSVKKK